MERVLLQPANSLLQPANSLLQPAKKPKDLNKVPLLLQDPDPMAKPKIRNEDSIFINFQAVAQSPKLKSQKSCPAAFVEEMKQNQTFVTQTHLDSNYEIRGSQGF